MPGSPRHDHIPPNMPAGVHGAEGLAGGCGGRKWVFWEFLKHVPFGITEAGYTNL